MLIPFSCSLPPTGPSPDTFSIPISLAMSPILLARVHMVAFSTTSLLQPNRNSRTCWNTLPHHQFNFSSPPTSVTSFFSGDSYDYKRRQRVSNLQLARDSNVKGSTKEVEHNAESDNSDKQQNFADKEPEDDMNILKYEKHGISDNLENEESRSSSDSNEESGLISGDTAFKGTVIAGLLLVGLVGGFGAVSYIYREQINDFLLEFSDILEGYGVAGYALFVAVYAGLEILAIPAIPLTMSAGLLFGTVTGTIIVSVSGTIAATVAFLIARYLARDRILKIAEGNKKFLAIDKAIGENGFRIVALLRLSPLLPFSLGNYLYGLTSVKLAPYVLGSWLGMLPGTWAYVSAGAVGRAIIQQEAENGLIGGPEQLLTLGAGVLATVIAATYVTRLAKDAIKDIE